MALPRPALWYRSLTRNRRALPEQKVSASVTFTSSWIDKLGPTRPIGVKGNTWNCGNAHDDNKRPCEGESWRASWAGCRRGSRDVCRRKHRHPGRHNDRRFYSGIDDFRYTRGRLVAQRLGLAPPGMGLASPGAMGLAPPGGIWLWTGLGLAPRLGLPPWMGLASLVMSA